MALRLTAMKHPDFRRFWLAQSGSVMGDTVVLTALALYVTGLTGNPSDLGLVLTAQALPLVVLLLVGGVWADRLPKQRLLLATDLVRAAVQATLAVLVLFELTQVWHLIVAGVAFGSAEAFARPSATGLLPETVPEDQVQEARALMAMSQNVAEVGGPAIGTALVVGLSASAAFAADALTFLLSAVLLARVRTRDRAEGLAGAQAVTPGPLTPVPVATGAGPSWRAELAEGWHETRSREWVWATILGATVALLLALAPLFVLGPTVAQQQYGSTAWYGVIMTAFGAGAVAGAVAGLRWRPRFPLRAAHLLGWAWPLIGALMGLGAPVVLVCVVAAFGGWGISLFDVWWNTALAERIPPASLSRVSSFDWMGSLALLPVGYALAGPAADAFGSTEVLVGGGVTTAVVTLAVVVLSRDVRRLERLAPGLTARPVTARA